MLMEKHCKGQQQHYESYQSQLRLEIRVLLVDHNSDSTLWLWGFWLVEADMGHVILTAYAKHAIAGSVD